MSIKYGMITGESNEDYHGNACVSASTIKDFIKSEYLYYRKHIKRDCKQETTKAMTFGSVVHEYILERDVFDSNYAVNSYSGATKEGRLRKAEIIEAGQKAITASELAEIQRLSDAVYANPVAKSLLSHGKAEVSWRTNAGAFDMQSRTDWFIDEPTPEQIAMLQANGQNIKAGQPVIVDLKTTQELDAWRRNNYGNAIHQFSYHLQLAIYLAVINKIRKEQGKEICRHFLFVVVEKKPPYDCAVIVLSERSFGLAQTQLKEYLKRLTACYERNGWSGYKDQGIIEAGIPENICQREEQEMFEDRDFTGIPFE